MGRKSSSSNAAEQQEEDRTARAIGESVGGIGKWDGSPVKVEATLDGQQKKEEGPSELALAGPFLLNKTDVWVDGILPFVGQGSGIYYVMGELGHMDLLSLAVQKGLPVNCLEKRCLYFAMPKTTTTTTTGQAMRCSWCSKGIPVPPGNTIEEQQQYCIAQERKLYVEALRQERPHLSQESFDNLCTHLQRKFELSSILFCGLFKSATIPLLDHSLSSCLSHTLPLASTFVSTVERTQARYGSGFFSTIRPRTQCSRFRRSALFFFVNPSL